MAKKDEVKIKHPSMGHVIFYNPTNREREILEDYILVKKTLEQLKPFINANVQRFNGIKSSPSIKLGESPLRVISHG